MLNFKLYLQFKLQNIWNWCNSNDFWDDINVKCFPRDPRIPLASWACWMMYVPPCTQWAREPTRPCCRSSESWSIPMSTSTAGTRASSSTTTLARSVWALHTFSREFGPFVHSPWQLWHPPVCWLTAPLSVWMGRHLYVIKGFNINIYEIWQEVYNSLMSYWCLGSQNRNITTSSIKFTTTSQHLPLP